MSKQVQEAGPLGRAILAGAIGWALWRYPPGPHADPWHEGLWWFGAACAGIGAAKLLPVLGRGGGGALKVLRAFGRDESRGSAVFMTEKEARKLGLHRRRKGSRFIGILGRTALWLRTETHHLILGPAGSSKTTAAILNFLMGCPESALITDIKGELWATTSLHRARAFRHRVEKLDPKDPAHSVKVNPLVLIARDVEANDPRALTRTRGMALQLHPDPQGGGGQNEIFYKGGRNLIVVVVLAVCVVLPPEHRTLATVYRALSDLDVLHDLLETAAQSSALNGEVADMARASHAAFFGDGANAKTAESFRVNALIALEAFGPGNYLAAITSETTFEFSELKERPTSLYILIDYANSEVLSQFSGLMQWMAADAMVSAGNNRPVLFILDEFCNSPLHSLPKILTLLRSAGVKCIMVTQDFDDVVRVYSKHALETVLSETHIKQILTTIRSKTTLEYTSAYLGEYSETSSSFSLGKDGVQESVARHNRRLLTEDELRRLPEDAQIVLHGNAKPILAKKVQVFAVDPWRRKLGINTIYGPRRKLLPIEVRLRWWGTQVTSRGARAYARLRRAAQRKGPNPVRRVLAHLAGPLLRLVGGLALVAALAAVALGAGLPNLRWDYAYRARTAPTVYVWCRYVGPTSPGILQGPDCPLILWRKPQ